MAGRTNNNLCLRNPYCGHAKILAGRLYLDQRGDTTAGMFTSEGKRWLSDAVSDLLPGVEEEWALVNQSSMDWPDWVTHRTRFTLPSQGDELDRFRAFEWEASWNLVGNAIRDNRPLHRDDLYDAMETRLQLEVEGQSGVYVRWHQMNPDTIRIGMTEKGIDKRFKGHEPFWRTSHFFATPGPLMARPLEATIQSRFEAAGAVRVKSAANSFYHLPSPFPFERTMNEIGEELRHFFRNTCVLVPRP